MSIKRYNVARGGVGQNITMRKKKASTAFTENTFVALEAASGTLIPATGATKIDGVMLQRVTSADSDYASTTEKQVDRPTSREDWFVVAIDDTTSVLVGDSKELKTASEVEGGAVVTTASVIIEKIIETGAPGVVAVSIIE